MKPIIETLQTGVKLAIVAVPLVVGASGTAVAHGGGGAGGGMMGGGWGGMGGLGGMGLFGGGMFLWPILLIVLILMLVYGVGNQGQEGPSDQARAELRDRYARGELSDDEFDRRREQLEGTG